MQPEEGGYHRHEEADVPEGRRYAFRLDGGPERPDPCSLWQPEGVHGPSAVVRPDRFAWTDGGWKGVRREDLVFYELHVGTFSPEGTFDGVIPRLRDLRELGVTAVEIMPVAQFPGARNWGYDGVLPYAAQDSYGGPHGPAAAGRRLPCRGAGGVPGRRLQPLRPRGELPRRVRPVLQRPVQDPVGRRGQLRRPRLRRRARLRAGQRPDVAGGVPLRRPPPGRRARDLSIWGRGTSCGRSRRSPRTSPPVGDGRRPSSPRATSTTRDCSTRASAAGTRWAAQWADDFHHAAHVLLHRRARGILRRLRRARATGPGPRMPVRLRVGLQPVPGPQARGAARGPLGRPLRRLPPEPRPGGQPGPGRPAQRADRIAGQAAAGRRRAPAVAVPAAAVHGRGVRRGEPVPLLLLVRRPGAGPGGARGPEEGVRGLHLAGRGARPPGRGDLRLGEAELVVARGDAPGGPAPALPRPAGGPSRVAGPARLRANATARLLEADGGAGPILELVRGGSPGESVRALFNLGDRPARLPGDVRRGHRSCSARRPPSTAASVARPGRPASWPRSSSSSWAPHPGGLSPYRGQACPA